ncbi:electron transfer flavoprotein subunit beta/FixA family protein [Ammoniphilus sp. YIM 78166]|uniref:electron transfer flavoprotein subunit beta/FixA family protein n=1 Tax=Ammoniphilus sp. YIM 78166 TaxID=1644106 RepID=UPI00107031E6|nr:electron transfer flavoprotein subunit beta/FixA family protein [Ammoniphilus sp. YIM 78166]
MNILVCIKQTFDTEEKLDLRNGMIEDDNVRWIVNPYDEYAIEEALSIREEKGGEVTVLTIGPERAEAALRNALAMGADRAVLIDGVEAADESTYAKVIAGYARDKGYDCILTGNQSIDNGAGQVGVRLAEELDIPHVTSIVALRVEEEKVLLDRDVEGELYKIETSFPLLVSCQQGLNEPRYPSLPNIMKAKKKPLERIHLSELDNLKDYAPKVTVINRYLPAKRQACVKIQDEPKNASSKLVKLLFEEAKII